jgi:adenosylhomocysteine nucleosidase
VVRTGIGQRAASAAAAIAFQDRPDVCITSGVAAGVSELLHVGDVIAPAKVRGPDGRTIDPDSSLLALAVRCGARAINTLYSAPSVASTSEQKREMSVFADAVDMESATILRESHRRGIPGLAIRAISDPASVDVPIDVNRLLTTQGSLSAIRTIGVLARSPQAVPGLVRLGVEGRRAAVALSAFLDAYVKHLAAGRATSGAEVRSLLETE